MKSYGLAVLVLSAFLAGCAGVSSTRPDRDVPQPLKLVSAEPLQIPRDCAIPDATVYRTSFEVLPDGRVRNVVSDAEIRCLNEALSDWVGTFRYEPISVQTKAVIDWIASVERRGS